MKRGPGQTKGAQWGQTIVKEEMVRLLKDPLTSPEVKIQASDRLLKITELQTTRMINRNKRKKKMPQQTQGSGFQNDLSTLLSKVENPN